MEMVGRWVNIQKMAEKGKVREDGEDGERRWRKVREQNDEDSERREKEKKRFYED